MENRFQLFNLVIVLGAVALFLLLPRRRRTGLRPAGWVLGLLALAGLVGALWWGPGTRPAGAFAGFAFLAAAAVSTAFLMLIQRQPLYSVLYFVLTVLAVALLCLLQWAEFLAFTLVIIYAGAILVIYILILMLSRQDEPAEYDLSTRRPFLSVLVFLVLLTCLLQLVILGVPALLPPLPARPAELAGTGSALALGRALFTEHMIALQVAGLLLLVSAVGALVAIRTVRPAQNATARRNLAADFADDRR